MPETPFFACARVLRVLADPARLRIIERLLAGPLAVCELAATLGARKVNVSHHLGILRRADIVCADKRGRFSIYRLNPSVHRRVGRGRECLDMGCCRLVFASA